MKNQNYSDVRTLNFNDNFESSELEFTVDAATEEAVRNPFRGGKVPASYLVTFEEGNGILKKGDTAWTADFLYFKNVSSTSSWVGKIRVFK